MRARHRPQHQPHHQDQHAGVPNYMRVYLATCGCTLPACGCTYLHAYEPNLHAYVPCYMRMYMHTHGCTCTCGIYRKDPPLPTLLPLYHLLSSSCPWGYYLSRPRTSPWRDSQVIHLPGSAFPPYLRLRTGGLSHRGGAGVHASGCSWCVPGSGVLLAYACIVSLL